MIEFEVEPFSNAHDVSDFRCSKEPALVEWLQRTAPENAATGATRTHLLVESSTKRIAGYFTLTMHSLDAMTLPGRARGSISGDVPALLLGRMARDERFGGRRIGDLLLVAASNVALDAARLAGARLLVLDAKNDKLVEWYSARNFVPVEPGSRRLYRRLSAIAKDVGRAWP